MRKLWRSVGVFWALAGTGIGIVGGYLAAELAHAVLGFWIVIAIAAAVAIFRWLGPMAVRAAQRLQNYQRLIESVASLDAKLEESAKSISAANLAAQTARQDGLREGQSRVFGAFKAQEGNPPRLAGIADLGGEVVLVGVEAGTRSPIGARYLARSTNTAQVWGIVELQSWDSGGRAILRCVEATLPKFWDALAQRVLENDAAPNDVTLEPYTLNYDPSPRVATTQVVSDEETKPPEESNG